MRRTFSWKKFKKKKKNGLGSTTLRSSHIQTPDVCLDYDRLQKACVILGEAEVWTFVFVVDVVSQTEKESSLSQLQCVVWT